MVFFFDEAHLLFKDAPKALVEKVEQVVKLIRSKGVGVYFCTQNPRDIPDGVLAQLGNKVEHALHAYTPADQKAVKAAAESFRENPDFNTFETIMALGTGEAVISFLEEGGVPGMAQKAYILPPQSQFAALNDAKRDSLIKGSILYSKYAQAIDPDSAYEFLMRKGLEDQARAEEEALQAAKLKEEEKAAAQAAKEEERAAARQAKEQERLEASKARAEAKAAEMQARAEQRQAEKQAAADERRKKQAIKSVGNSVAGTVGREVGKQALSGMGSFGKRLGGNVGASVGRGLLSTLFKL
jgi:flagellar biosynthesis GTPase FlhF